MYVYLSVYITFVNKNIPRCGHGSHVYQHTAVNGANPQFSRQNVPKCNFINGFMQSVIIDILVQEIKTSVTLIGLDAIALCCI